MSGAGMGTVGAGRVSSEPIKPHLNAPKWAYPGGRLPRTTNLLEAPARFSFTMLALGCAASYAALWLNRRMYTTTVQSMEPEFQDAARKIGPVAERIDAPPVFLNPITNRVPGYIRGPDDIPAGP